MILQTYWDKGQYVWLPDAVWPTIMRGWLRFMRQVYGRLPNKLQLVSRRGREIVNLLELVCANRVAFFVRLYRIRSIGFHTTALPHSTNKEILFYCIWIRSVTSKLITHCDKLIGLVLSSSKFDNTNKHFRKCFWEKIQTFIFERNFMLRMMPRL